MIKIKHIMDAVEADDGMRLWVEPVGLTIDMRQWCAVHQIVRPIAPENELWEWFGEHPEGYEFFRGRYHEDLTRTHLMPALRQLAAAGIKENYTLLHQGEDPAHNTATALYEFLTELQAHCPPDPQP